MLTAPHSQTNAPRGRADWVGTASFAIIALVVVVAFLPSLAHAPRADQWPFLLDMIRQESCSDLILNSYSYNRTRLIKPGDDALFRPVFFVYLSVLACVSGPHIWIPQAAGIALHLGVAWLAFTVLRAVLGEITGNARIAGVTAALVALYFATTPVIMEQVNWAHINAYMLAVLCVLGVMLIQIRAFASGGLTRRQIVATFLLSLVACFTFETALFLPVLLALCAAAGWLAVKPAATVMRSRLGLAAIFMTPLVVYCAAYFADLLIHPIDDTALTSSILDRAASWDTVDNLLRVLKFSVAYPLIAGKPEGFSGTRLVVGEPARMTGWFTVFLLVCIAATAIAGAVAARRLGERPRRVARVVGVLALAWLVSSVLIYTLGRVNPRDFFWAVLSTSSYHSYTPYLAATLLVGVAAACTSAATRRRTGGGRTRRWLVAACTALVILAIGVRAGIVRSANVQIAAYQASFVEAVAAINAVRDRDPFATFRMSPQTADRLETYHGVPILYTLYARSIDQCGGSYEILAGAPHVAYSPGDPACYPVLVQPHTNYLYYFYRGEFFGLPFWFGFPDEARTENNPHVIRAPTLRAAMSQYPAYHERLFRDLREGRLAPPKSGHIVIPIQ